MKINELNRVDITDMNENGVGIAKIDSAVVFIPGAVTGDKADIKILSCEKNYITAEIKNIINYSPFRENNRCSVSDICGGCTLGHVSYEYENIIKKNTVASAFRRAKLDYGMISDTVSLDLRESYRNKISLHYNDGRFVYYKNKTNDPVEFDFCLLCPRLFNEIIAYINENTALINGLNPAELQIRSSGNGGITVSLYYDSTDIIDKSVILVFKKKITNRFKVIENVNFINKTAKKGRTSSSYIYDKIGTINMRFSSEAFRQVNTPVFEKLLEIVCGLASQEKFSCGADLYCGSGIIGLTLAKRFPEVNFWGIEINSEAIGDAKYNCEQNRLSNIKFFCGDSASFREKLPSGVHPELITLDPPRAGLSAKMREDLIKLSPERIIYISCNPQTLARDVGDLSDNGYVTKEIIPVNMFPRTKHVETVCLLSKL